MVELVIVLIVLFWLLSLFGTQINIGAEIFDTRLLTIGQADVTVRNVILFCLVLWLIGALPRPYREIATILCVLWLLSIMGLVVLPVAFSLTNILVPLLVIGVIIYIIRK